MEGIFDTIIDPAVGFTGESIFFCSLTSAILGLLSAALYRLHNQRPSRNLMVTLVVMPVLVQSVIMLVNGSVGAGIAVVGAFNLVKFRSAQGTSREIAYIFYSMAIGIATGMGYIGYAFILGISVGAILTALSFVPAFGILRTSKLLRVVIPEDMDYTDCFKDLFKEYLTSHRLIMAKTVNMGTLYELRYEINLRDENKEKEFMDKIRTRNGNLTVSCTILTDNREEM